MLVSVLIPLFAAAVAVANIPVGVGTRRESQMFLSGDAQTGPETWPMVKFEEGR